MNLSVYLPDSLKDELETYVTNKGTNKNAAIRKAVELLLNQEKKKAWGDWIDQIDPDPEFPSAEELRKELTLPNETIFS